mmetsp:Transcript_32963/g.91021  ORF Transcript_32963/g.91021 Transcript_32963/m.91021 type:complete len:210 (+) Transcript_32963:798-1427(+)
MRDLSRLAQIAAAAPVLRKHLGCRLPKGRDVLARTVQGSEGHGGLALFLGLHGEAQQIPGPLAAEGPRAGLLLLRWQELGRQGPVRHGTQPLNAEQLLDGRPLVDAAIAGDHGFKQQHEGDRAQQRRLLGEQFIEFQLQRAAQHAAHLGSLGPRRRRRARRPGRGRSRALGCSRRLREGACPLAAGPAAAPREGAPCQTAVCSRPCHCR